MDGIAVLIAARCEEHREELRGRYQDQGLDVPATGLRVPPVCRPSGVRKTRCPSTVVSTPAIRRPCRDGPKIACELTFRLAALLALH